jgi:hypothetical protein
VAERFLRSTSRAAAPPDLAPQLVAEAAVPGGAPRQTPVGAISDKYEAAAEDARMHMSYVTIFHLHKLANVNWSDLVGDRPRGPLKQRGNPHLNPCIETC